MHKIFIVLLDMFRQSKNPKNRALQRVWFEGVLILTVHTIYLFFYFTIFVLLFFFIKRFFFLFLSCCLCVLEAFDTKTNSLYLQA